MMIRTLPESGAPKRISLRLIVAVSSLTPHQLSRMGELPPEVVYIAKPIDPQPFIDALQSVA